MFYQIFISPQVKRCVILAYKHSIYMLFHEMLKNLRKLGAIRKVSKPDSMTPQHPAPPPNTPPTPAKNSCEIEAKLLL